MNLAHLICTRGLMGIRKIAAPAVLSLMLVGSLGISQPAHADGHRPHGGIFKPKYDPAPCVPEPGSLTLVAVGSLALAGPMMRAIKARSSR